MSAHATQSGHERCRGDYVLALKGNHGTLYELVRDSFGQAEQEDFPAKIHAKHEEVDKGHGRVEKRVCVCTDNIKWLGLRGIVMLEDAVVAHWGIESMHWTLDMPFGEEGCRSRRATVVKNVATLRKMAFNLARAFYQAKKATGERMRGVSLKLLRRSGARRPERDPWRMFRQSPLT